MDWHNIVACLRFVLVVWFYRLPLWVCCVGPGSLTWLGLVDALGFDVVSAGWCLVLVAVVEFWVALVAWVGFGVLGGFWWCVGGFVFWVWFTVWSGAGFGFVCV